MQQDKRFTFAKADDDNIPKGLPDDFNNERDISEMPERDEDEFEVPDDVIDRHFISNRDSGDEHYPDTNIV
jgi:hypothetical protein